MVTSCATGKIKPSDPVCLYHNEFKGTIEKLSIEHNAKKT